MSKDLHISSATIQGWKVDISKARELIAALEKKLAAAVVLGFDVTDMPAAPPLVLQPSNEPEKFATALERIVFDSAEPLSKADLKVALMKAGHAKAEGPQFYTTLKRLKDRGRISVYSNGSVGPPP